MATNPLHLSSCAAAVLSAAALIAAPPVNGADGGCRTPGRDIRVPILMYHRINVVTASTPAESRGLTVHPADFEHQMTWLKRNGYRTITQRELLDALACGRTLGPRPIMITFDDGYRDNFFKASPVLLRLGMKATAYVVSSRISGPDPSFLTWPLLRGRPVVATRVGGIVDLVRDGENGLLVEPGDTPALADAIVHVLTDRALAERLAASARESVERWVATPEEYARRIRAVIDDVLGRGATRI